MASKLKNYSRLLYPRMIVQYCANPAKWNYDSFPYERHNAKGIMPEFHHKRYSLTMKDLKDNH
jgi:hypothetical protein